MLDMLEVTFLAVAMVILAVLSGAMSANGIPSMADTVKDFSFLIGSVLLPALTFGNTALSVNVEILVRCSILIFFAVFMDIVGVLAGALFSRLLFTATPEQRGVPAEMAKDVSLEVRFQSDAEGARVPYVAVVLSDELRARGIGGADVVPLLDVPVAELEDYPGYRWGSAIGFSMQNTVTLPLSLLQNMAISVGWLDFSAGMAYIFIFSIVAMLYLWSAGPVFLEKAEKASAKQRLVRELMIRHKKRYRVCDASTQTEVRLITSGEEEEEEENNAEGAVRPRVVIQDVREQEESRGERERVTKSDDVPLPRPCSGATLPRVASGVSSERDYASPYQMSRMDSTNRVDLGTQTRPGTPMREGSFSSDSTNTCDSDHHHHHHHRRCNQSSPSNDTDSVESRTAALKGSFVSAPASCDNIPYDWEREGILRVVYRSEMTTEGGMGKRLRTLRTATVRVLKRLAVNPPFMAILLGIVIGLVRPLQNLFISTGPLAFLMDAVVLIGSGNIPAALLLLGINLMGSTKAPAPKQGASRGRKHAEQNTTGPLYQEDLALLGGSSTEQYDSIYNRVHSEFSGATLQEIMAKGEEEMLVSVEEVADDAEAEASATPKKMTVRDKVAVALSLHGVSQKFVVGLIATRLILLPAFNFAVLVLLALFMPSLFGGRDDMDKTLLLVLFMEVCTPTAINSALLFNARQYMTYPWAKMLFFQYLLCSIAMVVWTSAGLVFCNSL